MVNPYYSWHLVALQLTQIFGNPTKALKQRQSSAQHHQLERTRNKKAYR